MEDNETEMSDSSTENTLGPSPVVEAPPDMRAVRRQRIDDYEAAGLAKPDPFDACLASITSGLIAIASEMGDAIQQSLAESPLLSEKVRRAGPAFDNYLRVTRQVDRFLHLEVRAVEARKREESIEQKLQLLALQGHLNDATGVQRRSFPNL